MKPLPHRLLLSPIRCERRQVFLLDQTQLPENECWVRITDSTAMAAAIVDMLVRGAPAIGVAAAYGMYLGAAEGPASSRRELLAHLETVAGRLSRTRPTAVNLFWAVERVLRVAHRTPGTIRSVREALWREACAIRDEDVASCLAIGEHGLRTLPGTPARLRLLTHCNAGALATAGHGTALGVVRSAWQAGRLERVFADETRPRLQGARLTAWELTREKIPVTVITDNMAAHCMRQGMIDAVVVGADRISRNGDTANKIGTYSLALVAAAHGIPFFVAAPLATVDFSLRDGTGIPIEERSPEEVRLIGGTRVCPAEAEIYNPAFDVTPARLITAIITEHGVVKPSALKTWRSWAT